MSKITDFYKGTGTDNSGRTIGDVWSFDDDNLECVHDYIQWLFPLPEASRFNLDAPLLTAKDIQDFKADPVLQQNMQRSFELLLNFYGFKKMPDGIGKSANYEEFAGYWLTPRNHNLLRISRILRCLTLVGLESQSKDFLKALKQVYQENKETIGATTFSYWDKATRLDAPPKQQTSAAVKAPRH